MASPSPPDSKNTFGSVILFALSVLSLIGALGLGYISVPTWGSVMEFGSFWLFAAIALFCATLLCVTLPGVELFRRTHNSRYRVSVRLSCVTLALLVLECGGLLVFGR